MKWLTDWDTMIKGTKDLRRQKDIDSYLERYWRAKVKMHGRGNVIYFPEKRYAKR